MKYIIEEDQLKQYIKINFFLNALVMEAITNNGLNEYSLNSPDLINFIENYNYNHNTDFNTIEACIDNSIQEMINDKILQEYGY